MTYDLNEKSAYGGRPVELYRFTKGTSIWRYTDSDLDVVYNLETYATGWPFSRTEPELSREEKHAQLKISTALNHPIALMFADGAPSETIWVTVLRMHVGDTNSAVIWQGKIRGVSWKASKGEAVLDCDPVDTVLGKMGFRQTFGPQCNKKLYSVRCGANEAANTFDAVITGISGLVVTSNSFSSKPNQYYRLGELWIPTLNERALIVDHVGNSCTLKRPIKGLIVGAAGRAAAGCDHCWKKADGAPGDCIARFNNGINFGGWPFVPIKNPYAVSIEG